MSARRCRVRTTPGILKPPPRLARRDRPRHAGAALRPATTTASASDGFLPDPAVPASAPGGRSSTPRASSPSAAPDPFAAGCFSAQVSLEASLTESLERQKQLGSQLQGARAEAAGLIAKLDATNGQLTLAQSRADEFSRAWRNAQAEVEKLQMELAAAKNGQITTGLVAGGLRRPPRPETATRRGRYVRARRWLRCDPPTPPAEAPPGPCRHGGRLRCPEPSGAAGAAGVPRRGHLRLAQIMRPDHP